jgi:hypothetical protein
MIPKVVQKEIYIALHGQGKKFRIAKWIFFIFLFTTIYFIFGGVFLLKTIFVLTVLSISMHFFYRHKTKVWTKDWGGYKTIRIPENLKH